MNRLRFGENVHPQVGVMRTFWQDLRFALRIISGNPGFAAVAILTLALGIAATTTVFSWMDALLWHPYPGTSRSSELALLEMSVPSAPNGGTNVSWLDYVDYRSSLKLISGVALQRYGSLSLGEAGNARPVWGELVSANYFQVLGVAPVLGSMFASNPQNDLPGAYPVTVISERLWRSEFHADPGIVGRTVRVNRRQLTVVGVAPGRFRGTSPALMLDLWVPVSMGAELGLMEDAMFRDRSYRAFASMPARLKRGVTIARAQSEASAVAAALAATYPKTNRGVAVRVAWTWDSHTGPGELLLSPLRFLLAVAFVLMSIVCANVANLLLARSVVRYKEFAVRLALGASRWRVARQLITETLVLAILGGLAALLILPWMWNALFGLVPDVGLPIARDFELNNRITAFAAVCGAMCALAAGAAPALLTARAGIDSVLREGGRGVVAGSVSHRARNLLVVAEVALAAVALISAGLFARSFWNMRRIHPGFDSSHVLFGRFFLEGAAYSISDQQQFALRLRRKLQEEPAVQAAAYADCAPLSTTAGPYNRVLAEGYSPSPGESLNVNRARVSPGYFDVLRIPLLAGRDFTESDDVQAAPVMIVNQTFGRRYFHSENVLGRRVQLFGKWATVVGMVRDSKYFSPAEPPRPFFYVPMRQAAGDRLAELDLFVRTAGEPEQAISDLRRGAAGTDASVASYHAVPLAEYTQVAVFPQKVAASLLAWLGAMCIFLAALGLYSVISCSVQQRAQEIGVRMAMGAQPFDVISMVLRQGMSLVAAGLVCGTAMAYFVGRLASGLLVNVGAEDPATFAGGVLFLALVAFAATFLPARRATRIDPMIALRQQ